MPTEKEVQDFVHTLEEGTWVRWTRVGVVWMALLTLSFVVLTKFRGLSVAEGMEQGEIAREIARGNGFSTKMIRPLALWQLHTNKGAYPQGIIPDTFHAPLNPWINSFFLQLVRKSWAMTTKTPVYACDYMIAQVSVAFFMLAITVNYFTAKRLFDRRLAVIGMGLAAICDTFWQFALSGLPQMLMLFLFSTCVYTLVRASEAKNSGGRTAPWLAAAGALFGLLALTHGLTIWIFAGAFLYTAFAFRPRGRDAFLMLGVFCLFYVPWLVRNHQVCGDFRGLGGYAILDGVLYSGSEWMRSMKPPLDAVGPFSFVSKLLGGILSQLDRSYGLLGESVVAPLFFVALLHRFKRDIVGSFRWCFLAMGLGAVLGMGLFGVGEKSPLQPNDLYILFTPMMIYYGLAFLLALWTRLEITYDWARVALLSLVYLLSAYPLWNEMRQTRGDFNWPPYIPPSIAVLNAWTNENEILISDMPWAVAWYADRRCLWLTDSIIDFENLNDFNLLGAPIVGVYLTPVSGDARLREDVALGEYKDWALLIMTYEAPKRFPFKYRQIMPIHYECVFMSDHPRWNEKGRVLK